MVYSREFRENALKVIGEIGVKKAVKALNVSEATLYAWRKQAREKSLEDWDDTAGEVIVDGKPEDPLAGVPQEMRYQWEEMKKLNESCRQTIAMLAEENVVLRKQCEDYLRAIALIAGVR